MQTLTLEQLTHTPLPPLDSDSVLFLWRPASRLSDALQVAEAWGFEPKTELIWCKTTPHGKRAFGMGRIVRGEHETCLIATRGRPDVSDKGIRSTFSAPAGEPFTKPAEFYGIAGRLYPHQVWYDRTARDWSHGWALRANAQPESLYARAARLQSGVAPRPRLSDLPHARASFHPAPLRAVKG